MRSLLAVGLLLAALLAGCSDSTAPAKPTDGLLDVSSTTGGIRGLVVDQSVVPVPGATISLSGGRTTESDASGLFNFTGLAPGDYFLQVTKPGFSSAQSSTTVVAGVADPPIVKLLLERLSTAQPYLDFFKLDGFYECAQALFFVVDTCDWPYRTAWDEFNESQGSPPPVLPRSAFAYANTQEIDVGADTFTIIQEAFWTDERVPLLWIMVDEWPIDAGCDCSDSYGGVVAGSPAAHRIERYKPDGSENTDYQPAGFADASSKPFPAGERVVSRGFLPPSDVPVADGTDPNTWYGLAQNFEFTIITTLFHNYVPDAAWTFETKDQFPVG
jgi:hypothetical protein